MALQRVMQLESGITLNEAYSRIEEFFFAKHGQVGMQVYNFVNANAAASYPDVQPISVSTYEIRDEDIYDRDEHGELFVVQPSQFPMFFTLDRMNPEGRNPVAQGYEYLKTLPEFAGAIDV